MNNQGKSIVIREGVRLYKQQRSPFWWLAVRVDGKETRISTKVLIESDPDGNTAARDKAIELAMEVKIKLEHGVELKGIPTFTAMADQTIKYLRSLTPQKQVYRDYIAAIERYLKPYFKRKPINQVDRHELFKFFEWRKNQTGGDISVTQKHVTNKALLHMFNLACDYGHIAQHLIPELPKVNAKVQKQRDFFTESELEQVLGNFKGFIGGARNKKSRETRQLLEYYVSFLLGTGARPGSEVVSLTFGHINYQRHKNRWVWTGRIIKGKNVSRKGERGIILGDRAVEALQYLIGYHEKYKGLTLRGVIDKYPSDLIFAAGYRDSPPEFGRSFKQYMDYLDMGNKDHTLYSLRHTYITQRLLADDMPRRAIAKQCGTSEEMIDQFYDHVISLDYAEELSRADAYRSLGANTLEQFFE